MTSIELNNLIKEGQRFNIFDTRAKERYDFFHLDNAINIEKGMLLENPAKYMNKNEKYYITCNGGNSATMVATLLSSQGYNIEPLVGGMNPIVATIK